SIPSRAACSRRRDSCGGTRGRRSGASTASRRRARLRSTRSGSAPGLRVLRFGTDGVRGDAERDLTSPLVVALGHAVARVLHPPRVVIGRDTRASGPRIEADLAAGLRGDGVETVSLGVLPTPAIAFIAATEGVPAAIVSASHNRWSDNGVKVIGADGRKLPDGIEAAIEAELERSSFVA